MAYTKYSLTPANNTAAPPDGAPEGMLPSAVNDTMRDMMAQIRDCGDGVRDGTYTMTAVKITGGTINGATIGATTATTGAFTSITASTTLGITGVATFSAGTVALPAITTTGDTNTGIFFPAADTIAFTEGGAEAMRINSSGQVGIGTSSPTAKIDARLTGTSSGAVINVGNATSGEFGGLGITDGGTYPVELWGSSLSLKTGSSVYASATEKMRIDSSGNVTLQKNISVGAATPTTSGTGITFPATQSASSNANTLDDYEEGTWTPTLTFGGVSTGITYAGNYGFYTKIGDQVFLSGYIELTNKGSATGYADIRGLTFTVQNTNGNTSAASLRFYNISFSGAFQGTTPVNTTQIGLTQITLLGAVTDLTDTNFSNNSSIIFAVNYRV